MSNEMGREDAASAALLDLVDGLGEGSTPTMVPYEPLASIGIVDDLERGATSSRPDPTTSPHNHEKHQDNTRHKALISLVATLCIFFLAMAWFVIFDIRNMPKEGMENTLKAFQSFEHFVSLLVSLISGMVGYYFGTGANSTKENRK